LLLADYGLVWLLGDGPPTAWPAWRQGWSSFASEAGFGLTVMVLAALLAGWGWLARRREWRCGARWLLGATLLAGCWAQVIKHLVGRPRPSQLLKLGAWLPAGPTFRTAFDSFPSGHAATVFATAPLLAALFPRAARLWPLLAAVVALGRVAGGSHYLSDVVAGALLGGLIGRYVTDCWRAELGPRGVVGHDPC
jgi:membrane-associated phospholipid phosphatase